MQKYLYNEVVYRSYMKIFSGLNQLEDISLDRRYGNICGYTQEELENYFKEYLKDVNLEEIKEWYISYNSHILCSLYFI